jgi:hypothetical protein
MYSMGLPMTAATIAVAARPVIARPPGVGVVSAFFTVVSLPVMWLASRRCPGGCVLALERSWSGLSPALTSSCLGGINAHAGQDDQLRATALTRVASGDQNTEQSGTVRAAAF